MANRHDIMHRFANKLEGKKGCICAGNVRYEGRNYFSYNTVFGQWLDLEKNVVAIFDGSTSTSSSKHQLGKWCFPDGTHVFPLDFGSNSYYGWRNCNLISEYNFNDEDFKEYHRMQMLYHYSGRMYDKFSRIKGGKSKGLENVSFEAWSYFEELCSLYKDCSVKKFLEYVKQHGWKDRERDEKAMKKMVNLIAKGERDVETITDAMFGKGTYKAYWNYCARYRKQSDKREKTEQLCHRLGIGSPYVKYRGYRDLMSHEMSADDIRNLTAKERVELHFKALAYKHYKEHEDERREKYSKNMRNAYKWIVGTSPKEKQWGGGYESDVDNNCINKDTGIIYECSGERIFGFYWCDTDMLFDYNSFRKSENKEQWIADFYAKCKEVALNRKAILTLKRINAHTKEKAHSWDNDVYLNDDFLRENTTEAEYVICSEFIKKQDKYFADQEARRRAEEIARLKREEEERKEKEYLEQVKKEQIVECLKDGVEGCRNLWRKHLSNIYDSEASFNDASVVDKDGDFFYGGSVLLRMNLNKDTVETSKNIRIPVEVCKKMWKIVSKWHENPSRFKSMQIDTKGSGKYTISSYKNDILTAGCHKIAYVEMQRMYNEIINA